MNRTASAFRRTALGTILLIAFLALGWLQSSAFAQSMQSLDELRDIAARFVRTTAGSEGGKLYPQVAALDPRLRLPACSSTPIASLPSGAALAARSTVGLRCPDPLWSLYVPVTIESEIPVLIAKRAAPRGATLTATEVERVTRRVPGFAGRYLDDAAMLDGRHLKTAVSPGTPLTVDVLSADVLVRCGQRVTLLASVGGIDVRAQGQAMADARPDGRVRVQNLSSLKVVEGRVESADLVRVTP